MAVASSGSDVFLAGWAEVAVYEADVDLVAPDARADLSALYFPERTTEQVLRLHNAGADILQIEGLSADVPDMDIRVDTLTVQPGESAKVRVRWSGAGDLSGSLCIATNDPDEPVQYLDILTSNDDSSVLINQRTAYSDVSDFADRVYPNVSGVFEMYGSYGSFERFTMSVLDTGEVGLPGLFVFDKDQPLGKAYMKTLDNDPRFVVRTLINDEAYTKEGKIVPFSCVQDIVRIRLEM